jgi:hypothetical protein
VTDARVVAVHDGAGVHVAHGQHVVGGAGAVRDAAAAHRLDADAVPGVGGGRRAWWRGRWWRRRRRRWRRRRRQRQDALAAQEAAEADALATAVGCGHAAAAVERAALLVAAGALKVSQIGALTPQRSGLTATALQGQFLKLPIQTGGPWLLVKAPLQPLRSQFCIVPQVLDTGLQGQLLKLPVHLATPLES